MAIPLHKLLADFTVAPPGCEQDLQSVEAAFAKELPSDYRAFLLLYDGGEGSIGTHYLILWKTRDLVRFNAGYEVHKYAPDFIFFGSTGGGDGFAFDARTRPYRVMQVPFVGMSPEDGFLVADSFTALLERMSHTNGPLF
ncbi:MAG TPA: SMI1/KNR4 family protein [Anaeromyxobacteraceae bacterium]|nr:SMI1/KNR4 family protein [Anaeromyxobacteraceae bacterium]